MIAVRGATTITNNDAEEIKSASVELFKDMITSNGIEMEEVVSLLISCTEDITKEYPGRFIREEFELNEAAIMHFNEMNVEGSLRKCIRFMLTVDVPRRKVRHVYRNEARNLRKDLCH